MLFGEGPQIKNIAADLNKLFRQGSLLNQSGQTVEGDSTADQGTSDLLAARDPVIQEISVGMSGEQSARYTVSGTPPLSLPNSLGKPLKAWSVDLLPYQEGTGDPSPDNVRPIHGTNKLNLFVADSYDPTAAPTAVIDVPPLGKNLLKTAGLTLGAPSDTGFSNNTARTWTIGTYVNGITSNNYYNVRATDVIVSDNLVQFTTSARAYGIAIPIKGLEIGQKYTVSAAIVDGYIGLSFYKADGTYISGSYGSTYTATVPEETEYTLVCFAGATDGVESKFTNIQLEKNDSATSYEPFNNTVYTGTIGSEGGESRWGEVDLGDLTWTYDNTTYDYGYFQSTISDRAVSDSNNFLCEAYANATGTRATLQNNQIARRNSSTKYVCIRDDTYSDVATFTASMQGIKLVYELETPTTFAVPSVTIPTPTGTATTWATAEDGTVDGMVVTYVGKA